MKQHESPAWPPGPASLIRPGFVTGSKTAYAIGCVILFWYTMHLLIGSAIIPSPWATIRYFIYAFPEIGRHLLVSLGRISAALAISLVLGSLIGMWIGLSSRADRFVTPVVYILYPLPKIAFLPVLMILFGLGNAPKIILIVIIIIFQIIIAARDGVRDIPDPLFHSVLSLGLGRRALYRHLILPSVLPRIMTAMRISIGISIYVLFYGESFATTYGIGYFIMNSWLMVDYVAMFSGILAISLLGLAIYGLLDWLERRWCPWLKAGRRSWIHSTD